MSTSNIFKVSTSFSADSKWILPDNAIEGILLGLPAIDLVFKQGVCTYWRSLISSADFVSAHLKRSNKPETSSHCLIVQNDFPLASGSPPPGPFKSLICLTAFSVIVVGSVNGLICLAGSSVTDGSPSEDITIFNPSTGLSRKLPLPSEYSLTPSRHMVKFVFWCHNGVYKVARIYSDSILNGAYRTIEGEVWDSSTDAWSPIAPILCSYISKKIGWLSAPDVVIEQKVVASDSAASAYWVADSSDKMFVLSLNLITLVLNLTPLFSIQNLMTTECLTSALNYDNTNLIPASIDGKFVLLQKNLSNDGIYDVWTMGVDGQEDWNKNSQFHLDFPFQRSLNCVNGKLLVKCFDSLAMYDMKTGMKDVFEFESISGISAHDFVGSLVSIEGFEYNVKPNAVIDVSWPYSFGSACFERRTGRFVKHALAGICQSELELELEQLARDEFLSEVKNRTKENEIRVLEELMLFLKIGFKTQSKEVEKVKTEIRTMKKNIYGMVVGVSIVAAWTLLGPVWYINLRKGRY